MKLKRDLVLLTNYYPFDKGEEYLESEIPILADSFESVVVVPLMTTASSTQTRMLPPGVRLVHPMAGRTLSQRMVDLARQASPSQTRPTFSAARRLARHPIRRSFDTYLMSRTRAALAKLLQYEEDIRPAGQRPVTIYSYWFYLTAAVGAELKRRWETEQEVWLVSRGHGYDVNVNASAVGYLPLREHLLEQVDALHPVSDTATDYLRRTYPSYAGKISTRRLGSPGHGEQITARQKPLHIVTVSTIRPLKRLDLVGEAVQRLKATYPDIRWTHLGGGRTSGAQKLTAYWEDTLGKATVDFVGHLSNAEVHRWYCQNPATVFVNASTSEGVPVSIMEAMSYGLPVIATDVGGTRELFTPSMLCGLVPSDVTAVGLAAAVRSVMHQSEEEYRSAARTSQHAWAQSWHAENNFRSFVADLMPPGSQVVDV